MQFRHALGVGLRDQCPGGGLFRIGCASFDFPGLNANFLRVEFDDTEIQLSWRAFVVTAVLQHDEFIAVGLDFLIRRFGDDNTGAALGVILHDKNIIQHPGLDGRVVDKENAIFAARLDETSWRQARGVILATEYSLVLGALLQRPRRQEKAQYTGQQCNRQAESEHGLDPRGNRQARRKPDLHFAITITAR